MTLEAEQAQEGGVILTVEDAIRDEAHRRLEEVAATFKRSIRLIYGESLERPGLPVAIGTGTLLRVCGVHLMLTARHVTDQMGVTSLHVAGATKLIPLEGEVYRTKTLQGRTDDPADFSAWVLPPALVAELGDVAFIEGGLLPRGTDFGSGALFGCMGFPVSKNKDVHAGTQSVRTNLWKYASHELANGVSASKPGADPRLHMFIQFDRRHSRDADGDKVNSPSPTGVSGGPVIYLGNLGSAGTYAPASPIEPKLAGILTAKPLADGDAMRATRIDVILRVLAEQGAIPRGENP